MKRLTSVSLLAFSLAAVTFTSCKDKYQTPTLMLNGESNMTIALNSSFTDPGATANDKQDGDLSSAIVVDGEVNADRTGCYFLYYNVTDDDGNPAVQTERKVIVQNEADFLEGFYTVTYNCGFSGSSSYVYTEELRVSETVNNRLRLSVLPPHFSSGGFIEVDGNNVDVPTQVVNGGYAVSGGGTVVGEDLTIDFNSTAGGNCPDIIFERQ